jgi:hypothetical protein
MTNSFPFLQQEGQFPAPYVQELSTMESFGERCNKRPRLNTYIAETEVTPGMHATSIPDIDMQAVSVRHFRIADVVCCKHGACDSCKECAGQMVHIPLLAYRTWCRACAGWLRDGELHYPALASIAAALHISPYGERILHIHSGSCRLAVGWALLFPNALFTCFEGCSKLHSSACAIGSQLEDSVRQRIKLFHCDPCDAFSSDWTSASIVVVSAASADENFLIARKLACLGQVQRGTRLLILSQSSLMHSKNSVEITKDLSRSGFLLKHEAFYRVAPNGYGSTRAEIYVKT